MYRGVVGFGHTVAVCGKGGGRVSVVLHAPEALAAPWGVKITV
jgi:hypothetical protein